MLLLTHKTHVRIAGWFWMWLFWNYTWIKINPVTLKLGRRCYLCTKILALCNMLLVHQIKLHQLKYALSIIARLRNIYFILISIFTCFICWRKSTCLVIWCAHKIMWIITPSHFHINTRQCSFRGFYHL